MSKTAVAKAVPDQHDVTRHFDDDFYSDAQAFIKNTKAIMDVAGEIKSNKVELAVDMLALARDASRRLDVQKKELLKPSALLASPISADGKALAGVYAATAEALAAALLDLLKKTGHLPEETQAGTSLSLVSKPSVVITNANQIPDSFLLPREQCIDMAKVADALKVEMAVNKTLVENGSPAKPLSVPGVKVANQIILHTRLQESQLG